jgi:hypothetical protein
MPAICILLPLSVSIRDTFIEQQLPYLIQDFPCSGRQYNSTWSLTYYNYIVSFISLLISQDVLFAFLRLTILKCIGDCMLKQGIMLALYPAILPGWCIVLTAVTELYQYGTVRKPVRTFDLIPELMLQVI